MADPATSAAGGAGGLPQFDLAQWPGQMAWALIIFAVLYLLIAKVFVPRIGGAIDAREMKIADEIGQARRMRDDAEAQSAAAAEEMTQARAFAHKVATDARAEAKAAALAGQAAEDTRVAEVLTQAEARIGAARSKAMGQVRDIATGAARAMIERLSGASPRAGELERALAGQD